MDNIEKKSNKDLQKGMDPGFSFTPARIESHTTPLTRRSVPQCFLLYLSKGVMKMDITITKTEKPAPVTILHLDGALDGSNHESLVVEAQKVYAAGARDLILDLSKLTFISSTGLRALHHVALLFQGKKHSGQEDESWASYRWTAYRATDRVLNQGTQEHVKLFSPTKQVREVLDMIGFSSLFEIYTDLAQATASFQKAAPARDVNLP
jgi:anti-anti-sigma factor